MRSFEMRTSFLSALLALSAAAAGACSSKNDCTLIECTSTANVYLRVPPSSDAMHAATVRACRNGVCAAGKPTSLPTFNGDRQKVFLVGALTSDTFIDMNKDGSYSLDVEIPIDGAIVDAGGDRYELHVTAPDGTDQAHVEGTASYQDAHPNGADCPTTCTYATVGTP